MNNIYELILENDLNPFIIFTSTGKLKEFNKEAEFLFNFVPIKDLYELCINNASQTYGINKEFINLKYKKQSFYAILVAYINDDEIAIRLYKEVAPVKSITIDKSYQTSNIFMLLKLSKNTSCSNTKLKIDEIYDTSIPEFKIEINQFLLTLNQIFASLNYQNNLRLGVHLKAGEYKIINQKKCHIVCIKFSTNKQVILDTLDYKKNSTMNIYQKNNTIEVEIPLIL
jgi:hypothetical protein